MAELPQTRQAFQELRGDDYARFGMHLGHDLTMGAYGIPVGETTFDPSRHSFLDVDPMSIGEQLTGIPQVTQVIPYRPIEMNVVLHHDPAERDLPYYIKPIVGQKQDLARGVATALKHVAQPGDETNLYIVGDVSGQHVPGSETIGETEDPASSAAAIAEICQRGLTVVISDFRRLPLTASAGGFESVLAIKANSQLELALPPNVGRVSPDGVREVNTKKPKELAKFNTELANQHAAIEANLGALGLTYAAVVYDNNVAPHFNTAAADKSIAAAIQQMR